MGVRKKPKGQGLGAHTRWPAWTAHAVNDDCLEGEEGEGRAEESCIESGGLSEGENVTSMESVNRSFHRIHPDPRRARLTFRHGASCVRNVP